MPHFPSLSTGAICQYPLRRRNAQRTIRAEALDGSILRMYDAGSASTVWELRYSGLTDEAWAAIETLFHDVEGRLKTFTFLDPLENLLAWTDDPTAAVWNADPLLSIAAGRPDPFGGANAFSIVNAGQAQQRFQQVVDAPGSLHYCYSLYARSSQATTVELSLSTASAVIARSYPTSGGWERFHISGNLNAGEDQIRCGLTISPGGSLDIFGPQLEAQPNPSEYKSNKSRTGVHSRARFLDDRLSVVQTGVNQCSATIRLYSADQG